MRLEEVAQGLVLLTVLLAFLLVVAVNNWEEFFVPAFRTLGAAAVIFRFPVLVVLAITFGFLAFRMTGPRR